MAADEMNPVPSAAGVESRSKDPPDHIPFAVPDISEEEVDAVARVVRSGWVTSGPEMGAFEAEFAHYTGGETATVAVNSATAGLHLVLEACGIGPGDEVILPTWTFTATAEVVRYVGATPVLVDIEADTLNVDLECVSEALSPKTRAVIPVHMAGLGVDVAALRNLVGPHVRIIEDAAHALPTINGGSRVGSCDHSDAAVFSFYATKSITTGEGGMIATRDSEIASRARVMRLHGIDRDAFDRYRSERPSWLYDVIAPGYKYNLTDPAAAMGRVQLRRMSGMHRRREDIARRYIRDLRDLPVQVPPEAPEGDVHAWHLFVLRLSADFPVSRDRLLIELAKRGVSGSVHFIPLHHFSYWRTSLNLSDAMFPNASLLAGRTLSLPLHSALSESHVDRIIDSVRSVRGA